MPGSVVTPLPGKPSCSGRNVAKYRIDRACIVSVTAYIGLVMMILAAEVSCRLKLDVGLLSRFPPRFHDLLNMLSAVLLRSL